MSLNNIDRLDLINDIDTDGNIKKIKKNKIIVERVELKTNKYNKKKGEYISILFNDISKQLERNKVINTLIFELKRLLNKKKLLKKPVLIVGLGNNYSTPDSLGPKAIKNIITTRHISLIDNLNSKYSVVSKISPGVFADTGIETFDIIKSIVKSIKPKYIIVIDALATKSLNKLNKLIQITDSGIDPGSGVGNQRKEISRKTLGVEVISIGVPTVVNLHTIVKDTLNEYDIEKVLLKKANDYLVTPKEIDFVIEQLSFIISKSINNTIHNLTE